MLYDKGQVAVKIFMDKISVLHIKKYILPSDLIKIGNWSALSSLVPMARMKGWFNKTSFYIFLRLVRFFLFWVQVGVSFLEGELDSLLGNWFSVAFKRVCRSSSFRTISLTTSNMPLRCCNGFPLSLHKHIDN